MRALAGSAGPAAGAGFNLKYGGGMGQSRMPRGLSQAARRAPGPGHARRAAGRRATGRLAGQAALAQKRNGTGRGSVASAGREPGNGRGLEPSHENMCHNGLVWPNRPDPSGIAAAKVNGFLRLNKRLSVNPDTTRHMFLEGNNFDIMKLLQKKYKNRIKVIYIDPPYNTMKNRLFVDKFGSSRRAAHSRWLDMMSPRLQLARELLSEQGMIFVSIGTDEAYNLRFLLNEVFGEKNMVAEVVWHSKYTVSNDARFVSTQHEYILIYAKDRAKSAFNLLPRTAKADKSYKNPDNDRRGPWKPTPLHAKSGSRNIRFKFKNIRKYDGTPVPPVAWTAPPGRYPRYSKRRLEELDRAGRITCGKDGTGTPNAKTYLCEVKPGVTSGSLWKHEDVGHTHEANEELARLVGKGVFDNPKPVRLLKRILDLATNAKDNDIVLDFFAGSGTTAHAVLLSNVADGGNRRFMCIQDNVVINRGEYRTIGDVAMCRIKGAIRLLNKDRSAKKTDCGFQSLTLQYH